MELSAHNRNRLYRRPAAALASCMALVALTAGCGGEEGSSATGNPDSAISDAAQKGIEEIKCYGRNDPFEDCDQDGVANAADVIPGRDDMADDDSDTVINKYDRYPAFDDREFDSDKDGTPDYLDTFFGNNYDDTDGDGLINGFDAQPYAAPPSQAAVMPPAGISHEQLTNSLLLQQMGRKFSAEVVGAKPDADYDGIPDDVDATRTEFTNDRDGDGDPDYYDPEPGDAYTDSYNDPYDPRNDEYWED